MDSVVGALALYAFHFLTALRNQARRWIFSSHRSGFAVASMAVESVASGSIKVAAIEMMSSGLRRRAYRLTFVTGQVDFVCQRKSGPLWNSCHFLLSWA